MYLSMFAAAYYGLLRVGELTTGTHPVRALDVHIADNKNKIMFILRTSKTHNKGDKPQIVKISSEQNSESRRVDHNCPFTLMRDFLAVRRSFRLRTEPFYIFKDRTPVTPSHMRKTLKRF